MFGTSSETIAQDIPHVEFSLQIDSTDKPPELPAYERGGLADLQESLAKFNVPLYFHNTLKDYLTDSEREKLALHDAIKRGLWEAARVFQPKRYGKYSWSSDNDQHYEANLWLRALWQENMRAGQVERAFEVYIRRGRKFPAPADLIKLASDPYVFGLTQ